jgi:hypothetical protein
MPPKRPPTPSPRKSRVVDDDGQEREFSPYVGVSPTMPDSSDDEGEPTDASEFRTPEKGEQLREQAGAVAGELKERALDAVDNVKKRLDTDGDGVVSRAEVVGAAGDVVNAAEKQASRFIKSPRFKALVHETFVEMDMDGTGALSKVEVYCAVLKLYCKIIKFCSSAQPPTKLQVDEMVEAMDDNRDSTICESEFGDLAAEICEHVAVKLVAQSSFTLIGAPLVARLCGMALDVATPGILTFWIPFKRALREGRNSLLVAVLCAFVMPKMLDWMWQKMDETVERRNRFEELEAEPEPEAAGQ